MIGLKYFNLVTSGNIILHFSLMIPSPDGSGIPHFFCVDTADSRKQLLKNKSAIAKKMVICERKGLIA